MKSPLFLSTLAAASLLTISGCASVAETSTAASAENKCKITTAQTGRINHDASKVTELDKTEARAKLASIDLKMRASRNASGSGFSVIDQALRDCM